MINRYTEHRKTCHICDTDSPCVKGAELRHEAFEGVRSLIIKYGNASVQEYICRREMEDADRRREYLTEVPVVLDARTEAYMNAKERSTDAYIVACDLFQDILKEIDKIGQLS